MPHDPLDHSHTLQAASFPDDDGAASAETRAALAAAGGGDATDYLRAVATLCGDRVLVPVVATAMATTADGFASDKQAEMSVVSLLAADGRRAMLAFTGIDALAAWNQTARPVPVTLDVAAEAAVADAADALLVDSAGPASLVIEDEVLRQLASGHRLIDLGSGTFGWAVRT